MPLTLDWKMIYFNCILICNFPIIEAFTILKWLLSKVLVAVIRESFAFNYCRNAKKSIISWLKSIFTMLQMLAKAIILNEIIGMTSTKNHVLVWWEWNSEKYRCESNVNKLLSNLRELTHQRKFKLYIG